MDHVRSLVCQHGQQSRSAKVSFFFTALPKNLVFPRLLKKAQTQGGNRRAE